MRSRLAPSPTGPVHLGNARTFLLTWLHVRAAGGSLVMRACDLLPASAGLCRPDEALTPQALLSRYDVRRLDTQPVRVGLFA